jgi:hypothetical protein
MVAWHSTLEVVGYSVVYVVVLLTASAVVFEGRDI